MERYKNKYRIQSNRLQAWDYSSGGYYFVTICAQNRIYWFGDVGGVDEPKMNLSPIGEIAYNHMVEIAHHFDNIEIDDFIIMPNHVHCLLYINNGNGGSRDLINQISTKADDKWVLMRNPKQTLGKIIRHYKAKTSKLIHDAGYTDFAWQKNYHEHIIRDEEDLNNKRDYILKNPLNWHMDENYIRDNGKI